MSADTPRRTDLSRDEVLDRLGAYALGALEPEEQAAVEAHLAGCPSCRAALDRYDAALGAFAATAPPASPPPALRARLVAEAAIAPPADAQPFARPPVIAMEEAASRRRGTVVVLSRPAVIGLGLVASLLLAAVIGGGLLLADTRADLDDARADRGVVTAYVRDLSEYVRNGGTVTPMTAVDAGTGPTTGRGSLFVAPAQDGGMIVVSGLPATTDDQEYRVWVARGTDRTGVDDLWVTDTGFGWLVLESPDPLTTYDTLGITLVTPAADGSRDLLVAAIPKGASG